MKPITLYYVHDPMCAWCFGFRDSLNYLVEHLPSNVRLVKLVGGLAPDSDAPMPDDIREYIQQNWRRIETTIPGVQFNYDFWTSCAPRRSTYPSCRAVIAARLQDVAAEDKMINAIQSAYYQQARNPSDVSTLTELAVELGLSGERFARDIESDEVNGMLIREIQQTRAMGANSFPSLVLELDGGFAALPLDYVHPERMLDVIKAF